MLAVSLLRRLHLPPILGYLLVGMLAGPHALGWVHHSVTVELLGEVGVVFLLFMIGLEISIPHLMAMRRVVLGLGGAQVAITMAVAAAVAVAAGLSWQAGLIVGGAVAMSSTAIVAKQLTEQLEMQSRHGRIALGILLFQDLAVVPFLVVIPIFAAGADAPLLVPLLWAMGKAIAAFLLMLAFGHWLLRPLFHWVAAARSVELFTLTILLVSLAAAWVTFELGLSLALGAFLAGMMLSETEYRHQIEIEVRPFRDVLLGLFFITVGTNLDLAAVWNNGFWVLLLTLGIVLGKGLLIYGLSRLAGRENGVALRAGTVLAQGGEFGFALFALAMAQGLLGTGESQPILAAVVLSMLLAPILIRHNGHLAQRFCHSYLTRRADQEQALSQATHALAGHVIICGFGRIGQNLASFLREEGFQYVALDLDPLLIREAWQAGEEVYYGDSGHREILAAAGLSRARALVVTFDDHHLARRIIGAVRHGDANLPVVVRVHNDLHMEELEQAGATEVVPESVEASMMLATHTLERLGVPREEVLILVDKARRDHYQRLRGQFHGQEMEDLAALDTHRLHTVVLDEGAYGVSKPVGELLGEDSGVRIHALRRGGIRGESPAPELCLEAGDVLVLEGPAENLDHAEEILLRGLS